ncbi:MAG: hypothetical protein U9Q83_02050 [Bacteroidota bacterium]|nr:hypothetical protein [Bacteroidota bacterium]
MKKVYLLVLVFVIVSTNNISAQKLSYSPLTYYGIGDIYFQGNTRQQSMGNTGIGDFTNYHISKINPANISALSKHQAIFEIGFFHRISNFSTSSQSQINNLSNIKNIYGAFTISNWWHTSFGINPYSGSGYKIVSEDTASTSDYSTPYEYTIDGLGSMNQIFWGNSFTFFKKFSVAANLNYNFGSFDKKQTIIINYDSSFISASIIKDRNIFRKVNFDFGFAYNDTIKRNNEELLRFSLGGIYSNKTTINTITTKYTARTTSYFGAAFTDSLFFDTTGTSSIVLPQTLGFGISMTYKDKFTFSADYIIKKWSESVIFEQNNFVDSRFIGIGMEYCASKYSSIFYKTIRYQIGAYQNNSYLTYNGKQITTQAFTTGISFPVKRKLMINIGYSYGQRGDLDIGLKENFHEFNLGMTLYDIWFVKRRYN